MTKPYLRDTIMTLAAVWLSTTGLAAQADHCVACHVERFTDAGIPLPASERRHLDDWERSAHGASGVGCHQCHGGDPAVTTLVAAHERILSATNPASPVHALNVPETCGGCHSSQLEAFRTSRHSELASQGIPRAPTCLTCHGAVAARFPSTQGLEGLCASCHGPNGPAPRSAYQSQVRLMRDLIDIDRYQLALARAVLPHVANAERREALEAEYRDAEDLLDTAVASWHSFTFETAAEPLAEAGRAISGLVERLTAP